MPDTMRNVGKIHIKELIFELNIPILVLHFLSLVSVGFFKFLSLFPYIFSFLLFINYP